MSNKLKTLTEKLFNEGIEKGEKQAGEIISGAKKEADKIIGAAKEEASKIIEDARREAEEKRKKTEAEIKLAATQSISLLKNQISKLISSRISEGAIDKVFDDSEFVKKMILSLIDSWTKNGSEAVDMKLLLPGSNGGKGLEDFLKKNCKNIMDRGLEISVSDSVRSGFKVGPKDSSYVVEFSEDSFSSFFKDFLKPATKNLIFSDRP